MNKSKSIPDLLVEIVQALIRVDRAVCELGFLWVHVGVCGGVRRQMRLQSRLLMRTIIGVDLHFGLLECNLIMNTAQ